MSTRNFTFFNEKNAVLLNNGTVQSNERHLLRYLKFFVKVPSRRLILKIIVLKTTGVITLWIEILLRDRKQRVIVITTALGWAAVTSRVSQESVLASILSIIIYVSYKDDGIVSEILKFTDNTNLWSDVVSDTSVQKLRVNSIR